MTTFWWSLLNLLAWGFGLKAVFDLRAEWVPRAKTWFLVTQAVLSCLTMEAAMMGAAYLGGLAVLSSLTGVAAGIFMWLAVRSLSADLRLDQTLTCAFLTSRCPMCRAPIFWIRSKHRESQEARSSRSSTGRSCTTSTNSRSPTVFCASLADSRTRSGA